MKSELLSQIPGLLHGFGDAETPLPEVLQPYWTPALKPSWHQVHSAEFNEVHTAAQKCGEVDALYTRKAGLPIAIVTADCVPLLLARKDGKAAAAIHAGWRGTHARIVHQLWESLRKSGESSSEWVAAIGPSIRGCCYEVDQELIERFDLQLSKHHSSFPRKKIFPSLQKLDLASIHLFELTQLEFDSIDVLPGCTFCSRKNVNGNTSYQFQSYRRDHAGLRQYSGCLLLHSQH